MGRSSDREISPVATLEEVPSWPVPLTGLLAEPLALDEEGFQELERLCVALGSLRGHPALFLAFYDSPLLRDRLIAEVAARLPDWRIRVFKINQASQDFLPRLASEEGVGGDAVFLIIDPETVDTVARYLNYRREVLGRLPYPMVLWFPYDTERRVHQLAPDFWAFRRQVFVFRLFAPWLLKVSQKVAETSIPAGTPEDRQARMGLLRQLLGDMARVGAGHTILAARLHRELGDLLRQENLWQESRRELEQALAIVETEGRQETERAHIFHSLGLTLYYLDEYDAALASYEAALGLYRAVGDRLGRGQHPEGHRGRAEFSEGNGCGAGLL